MNTTTETAANKREKTFTRSYDDVTGDVTLTEDESPVIAFNVTDAAAVAQRCSMMRYFADVLVSVGNAMRKAEKPTAEIHAAIAATWKKLQDGTFPFRSASGQGELTPEQEHECIAAVLVKMGKTTDPAIALAKVQALYAETKVVTRTDKETKETKEVTTRPRYNKLKNLPEIRAALAIASGASNDLDNLLDMEPAKEPEAPATE
jgi:hypothetical protein